MLTLDLKSDWPSVDEARLRLAAELREARSRGVRLLKISHGYGSTGKGGALNETLRRSLRLRKKEGVVRSLIPGKAFYATDPATLDLLQKFPDLSQDCDYGQRNPGITILELA